MIRPAHDPILYPGVPLPDPSAGRWVLTDFGVAWEQDDTRTGTP